MDEQVGFVIGGETQLQFSLPVHQSIAGVASLEAINFAPGAGSNNSAQLDATLDVSASIGPVAAAVTGVGLRVEVVYLEDSAPVGNMGNVDLRFGFKSPSGVGLKLD